MIASKRNEKNDQEIQIPKPIFSSNLTAVLNDPSKERNKKNNLFTKTWGYDFIETPASFFTTCEPYAREFKQYKNHLEFYKEVLRR